MSETYQYRKLLAQDRWKDFLPLLEDASDTMARFDERMNRGDALATGVQSRGHFREACATVWLQGSHVRFEDLVLHDAAMDLRAPSSELLLASAVLRVRREICRRPPEWSPTESGPALFSESTAEFGLRTDKSQRGDLGRIDDSATKTT